MKRLMLGTLSVLWLLSAHAALQVEILGAPSHQIPLVIAAVADHEHVPPTLDTLIQDNLSVSGAFRVVPAPAVSTCDTLPTEASTWRASAIMAFWGGFWSQGEIHTCLWDVPSDHLLHKNSWPWASGTPDNLLVLADAISDEIYQQLTGLGPYFSSRILYVKQGSMHDYAIQSTDVTGQAVHTIYASQYPILSPVWDDSGRVLLFVSFRLGKPVVELIDFVQHKKETVANFKGTNSSGTFSHRGDAIAMTLTKDGHSQIYEMRRDTGEMKRLMTTESMDTEPTYSPDDQYMYFTSNREGSPQIYRLQRHTGAVQRVSFHSRAAYSPSVSHDGQWLAYVAQTEASFVIAIQSLVSGEVTLVSQGPNDLHPTFSPNDAMIAFSHEDAHYQRVLSVVSRDGHFHYTVRVPDQKIRQPFWGPLAKS